MTSAAVAAAVTTLARRTVAGLTALGLDTVAGVDVADEGVAAEQGAERPDLAVHVANDVEGSIEQTRHGAVRRCYGRALHHP